MVLSDKIYDLIVRKQLNKLTPEEEGHLQDWLNESAQNQEEVKRIVELLQSTKRLYAFGEPDLEECYQEFVRTLQMRRQRRVRILLKYAAIFLLPLALGVLLYNESNDLGRKSIELTHEIHEISPVTQKVQLLLSSGKSVDLTVERTLLVGEESGVVVNNDTSGLNYSLKETVVVPETSTGSNTLIVPRGAEYNLTLADGTRIWMNAESELRYPVKFTGKNREVYLKGEAYFEVASNANHPFIVKVQDLNVRVLGTSFNIMAYANEPQIETTLESGRVEVFRNNQEVALQPGMQAVFRKSSRELSTRRVNTLLYTSWKESQMVFEELRLEELLNRLSRWYDVNIFYQNNDLKDIRLTGNLSKHECISSILDLIRSMGKADFQINGRTIIVKRTQK